ncbi:MAG: 16S rRNA (cytosine(1402)-N(4))-methyltransferase RsmH [bacterium]|nr:16S rRNA (cytosine(1402)-N(4))-methyltransferase RsmH [bacterium]
MQHVPVLPEEVLHWLDPQIGDVVVDCTFGAGGHSCAFCKAVGATGSVFGIDADRDALERARGNTCFKHCSFTPIHGNFRHLTELLEHHHVLRVDRFLFDLGLSSDQLDTSGRGFSFMRDEPLIMTLSDTQDEDTVTAEDVVNSWSEESLADIIYGFSDERFARRIASHIVAARSEGAITTTGALAEIVIEAIPPRFRNQRIHPATRTFQAIRMAVNDEVGALRQALPKAWSVLSSGGRIAVISFHSLEDRIAKEYFREWSKDGVGRLLVKKPIVPAPVEISSNPRARSAKLRIIEKI